ncbi:MAG: hypothetical protein R3C01_16180 [Planctomycetaceae bacterium]
MAIEVLCECGRRLKARDEFAGTRAECPTCGAVVEIPSTTSKNIATPENSSAPTPADAVPDRAAQFVENLKSTSAAQPVAMEIVDFLDPPQGGGDPTEATPTTEKPVVVRMMEALLDPRAIHWLLTIGGGLAVLGLIIWLVSAGVFDDPRLVAGFLGVGSLGILAAGWWTTLKTRFHLVGQALTFLGCVVLPLNLWFYHAQGLVDIENHLWVGSLVCVLFYVATVIVLKDPLFMYAIEAGVTLTVLLLMADVGQIADAGKFALMFVILGAISIHTERAFAPDGEYSRKRFGLPLFWSGHVQLAVALLVLLWSQSVGWFADVAGLDAPQNLLTQSSLLAGGLWLAGSWLYLYSDLAVRRLGVYTWLAGVCLLLGEVSLILPRVETELMLVVLAVTALTIQILRFTLTIDEKIGRHLTSFGALLAALPVLLGVVLHLRATGEVARVIGWTYSGGWLFVGAMVIVAVCNRASAYLTRHTHAKLSETFFFFSAASVLVAAAGLLREWHIVAWYRQAPLLMLIPLGYIIASRLWRGHSPETPLARVAHASTLVILFGTFVASLEHESGAIFRSLAGQTENLHLGVAFLAATVFYVLAAIFRGRHWNIFLATAAGSGALWQFLGYFGVPSSSYPLVYAALGLATLFASRVRGVEKANRFNSEGDVVTVYRGPGLVLFQCGNAVLSIALLSGFLQGLTHLAGSRDWLDLFMILATTAAGLFAIPLSPAGGWRNWYTTATIGLAGVAFLTLNLLIDLDPWRKVEVFSVIAGVALLVVGHIGRFREEQNPGQVESTSLCLWLGSLLTLVPLFVTMLHYRFFTEAPSLYDEFALMTASIVLLVAGCAWQVKAGTLLGGVHLFVYLAILIVSIAYRPEVAVGVYLLVGGGVLFLVGLLLSIYRETLIALPEKIARREGIFRVMDWR